MKPNMPELYLYNAEPMLLQTVTSPHYLLIPKRHRLRRARATRLPSRQLRRIRLDGSKTTRRPTLNGRSQVHPSIRGKDNVAPDKHTDLLQLHATLARHEPWSVVFLLAETNRHVPAHRVQHGSLSDNLSAALMYQQEPWHKAQ